jgi:ElaB/YqjD/DUF883 family membrane-anchored ribosome-binding protein
MITSSHSASVQQNTRQVTDGMMNAADKAIDTTRSYANHALDAADEKMHALQSKVEPALDRLSSQAQALAKQGLDIAAQAKDKARESLTHYTAATSRYVSDKPVQSVLIAAAVGAAVALLVSAACSRQAR